MDRQIHKTAIIKRKVEMGDHIAIDPFFYMTTGGIFRHWIHINSHVSVIGGEDARLFIGNHVAISTGCRLICRSDDFTKKGYAIPFMEEKFQTPKYGRYIAIKNGAILGANVVVLPDVTIGEGAAIGANSMVNCDVPDNEIWAGTPAKKIGMRK